MEARAGSLTVAALVGTGLATIGFALSGVSALGDDLQTAARQSQPAPVLTPGEESRESGPVITPPATAEELTLEQVCDREKRDGADGTTPTTKPADDHATPTTPAREL